MNAASLCGDLDALRSAVDSGAVSDKDKDFALSLIAQAAKRGLSPKQEYWVKRLVFLATPSATPAVQIDAAAMYALFDTVAGKLRYPKITLTTKGSMNITLYVSGVRSRNPGVIHVVGADNEVFYGRLPRSGVWDQAAQHCPQEQVDEVIELLREFASNPVVGATKHGHLHGNCCFCRLPLTDERSVSAGYGPVCAKKWGLSWK